MNVLIIAPHADDEILGVGGTIAKLTDRGNKVYVCVTSRGYEPDFSEKLVSQVLEEARQAHEFLGITKTYYLNYPASALETVRRGKLISSLHAVIEEVKPEMVFIPHFGDLQKDHEIIAKFSMVALRAKYGDGIKNIYAYETVSETECNIPHITNSFMPNVFSDISDYLQIKLEAMKKYESQLGEFPYARSVENLTALARYRGTYVQVRAAEAFVLIRQTMN